MANKENISIKREEYQKIKEKLSVAYTTGYRQGMENGFKHGVEIGIEMLSSLKKDEVIKNWCDEVFKNTKVEVTNNHNG